jgi:hypothetical protein
MGLPARAAGAFAVAISVFQQFAPVLSMLKPRRSFKNGEVLDPGVDLRGRRDVAFRNGVVAAVAENIVAGAARETIDVSGKIVTPGDRYPRRFFSPLSAALRPRGDRSW